MSSTMAAMTSRDNQEYLYKKKGSRKEPSGAPGKVDFPVEQVTFPRHVLRERAYGTFLPVES